MKENVRLTISGWTILKVALVLIGLYFLFLIRDVIALFFIVLVLFATFSPIVYRWSKTIGRIGAVAFLLILLLAAAALGVYIIIPPVIDQIQALAQRIPDIANQYSYVKEYAPNIEDSLSEFLNRFGDISQGVLALTANLFGGLITFITAIVLFVYLLLDEKIIKNFVVSLFPSEHRDGITNVLRKVAQKLGDWFRGQIVLGIIVAILDLIGLLIIGVPYALTLAIISGFLEIVPAVGPIVAGIIAASIALTDSPLKALLVIILYIVVQQLENNIIVPKVMQKVVGLSPIIIILTILIGAKLMGIVGAMIAVPIAATIAVLVQEWPTIRKYLTSHE